jgi:hypothetical protein
MASWAPHQWGAQLAYRNYSNRQKIAPIAPEYNFASEMSYLATKTFRKIVVNEIGESLKPLLTLYQNAIFPKWLY